MTESASTGKPKRPTRKRIRVHTTKWKAEGKTRSVSAGKWAEDRIFVRTMNGKQKTQLLFSEKGAVAMIACLQLALGR